MSVANEHFCSLSTRMQALAGSYVAMYKWLRTIRDWNPLPD